MTRTSVILGMIASTLVLCQWFALQCVKKYLFQKSERMKRRAVYLALMAFGPIVILALRLEFGTEIFSPGTFSRQMASVIVFSYLGWVLMLSLLFLPVRAIDLLVRIKDALIRTTTVDGEAGLRRGSQAGCVSSSGIARDNEPQPQPREKPCSALPGRSSADRTEIEPSGRQPTRRTFLKAAAASSLVAATGLGVRGISEAYGEPTLEKYDFFHDRLRGLAGPITLIHVTDCHFGMFLGPKELHALVQQLNSLEGDALCITGDVFHSARSVVEQATPILRRLKARTFGNLAVLGNHDFYAREARSVKSLQVAGIRLLRNEWITLKSGKATVFVGGIDDPAINWLRGTQFSAFEALIQNSPAGPGMRILLSHRPGVFPRASEERMDLVLAGHLHGGQIVIPVLGQERGLGVADLVSDYTYGWYRGGLSRMYLSRGVGLTFLPWRINCRPEITTIRLNPTEKGIRSGSVRIV